MKSPEVLTPTDNLSLPEAPLAVAKRRRAVAIWLLIGVGMIMVQIALGGITRLTGSGLSITKWNPLFGFIPPLNAAQWEKSFAHYQEIAQYKFLNSHFTLAEFKEIFFWEWLHRFWARLLGIVFLIGFIYFLVRRYFDRGMMIPFLTLFLLGAAQGLIGWIMVKSGLNDSSLYVNHIKLALHFIAALGLLCYTFWFALQLLIPPQQRVSNAAQYLLGQLLLGVLFLQLTYGAFMAGLKAASIAPTWPDINGEWIPELAGKSWINHPIAIHFVHRGLAYILVAFIFFAVLRAARLPKITGALKSSFTWPLWLVCIQLFLGIASVLTATTQQPGVFGTFEILALAHQLVAMLLLMSLTLHLYLYKSRR